MRVPDVVRPAVAERAAALVEGGVDVLVVDTAHGHQDRMLEALATVRAQSPSVPVVAGNVVTADGVEHPADVIVFGTGFRVGDGLGHGRGTRVAAHVLEDQLGADEAHRQSDPGEDGGAGVVEPCDLP